MIQRRGGVSPVFGLGAACAMLSGCLVQVVPVAQVDGSVADAPVVDAAMPTPDAARDAAAPDPALGAGSVDLLVVVDDSNSMRLGQDYLNSYIGTTVYQLLQSGSARDVHVGVITTDLGVAGAVIPSCAGSRGDDGVLNPIVRGAATSARSGVTIEPVCAEFSAQPFITVTPADDPMAQMWKSTCHTRVGVGGCGLEQQLEAVRRALVDHGAAGGLNAGFLRRDATLAILVLSDEDDGSVRDCRNHDGVGGCDDAVDVYDPMSSRWASSDLNLRFYNYAPGGSQDPTWPIERYVDPARPTRGLLGLKPGHPERIVFAAITGVPIDIPRTAEGATDWDALLGAPAAGRPDDFNARDASRAFTDAMHSTGPISMRQHDADPTCSARLIPACRKPATSAPTSCDPAAQPFAWRARRIAEVARRFDQSRLCNGSSCGNGMVASICDDGTVTPFQRFAELISRRIAR